MHDSLENIALWFSLFFPLTIHEVATSIVKLYYIGLHLHSLWVGIHVTAKQTWCSIRYQPFNRLAYDQIQPLRYHTFLRGSVLITCDSHFEIILSLSIFNNVSLLVVACWHQICFGTGRLLLQGYSCLGRPRAQYNTCLLSTLCLTPPEKKEQKRWMLLPVAKCNRVTHDLFELGFKL